MSTIEEIAKNANDTLKAQHRHICLTNLLILTCAETTKSIYFTASEDYIYLAAIYNDDHKLLIITKDADKSMSDIHDRMPVIMNQKEMLEYLKGNDIEVSYKELTISNINSEIKLF